MAANLPSIVNEYGTSARFISQLWIGVFTLTYEAKLNLHMIALLTLGQTVQKCTQLQ